MSMPTFIPLSLLVFVAACLPPSPAADPMASWQAQTSGSAARPHGDGLACASLAKQLDDCPPLDTHAQIRQPSADAAAEQQQLENLIALSRQGLRQQCPGSALDPHFANQDRCLATRREEAMNEQAEQRERLPAERKRVAAVKRDPAYPDALDRYRRAVAASRRASEDLQHGQQREGLDCGRRSEDCARLDVLRRRIEEAEQDREQAEGKLRRIAVAHQIDERDGVELGLW